MMSWLKKLTLLRLLILVIQSKKHNTTQHSYNTKTSEIEKKVLDHDDNNQYITIQEFKKITTESFIARLKQADLATKAGIDDFVEKTEFDDKLKNLNEKVTSKKTKHLEAERKFTDLTNKVVQTSEKGYDFCYEKCLLQMMVDITFFQFLPPILSSLILDSNKKVTN